MNVKKAKNLKNLIYRLATFNFENLFFNLLLRNFFCFFENSLGTIFSIQYMAYLYHQNSPPKYYCKKCDYGCSKKSHWDQHLLTAKHKSVSFVSKNSRAPNEIICKCGKKYKTKCGYKRHQAKCKKKYWGKCNS